MYIVYRSIGQKRHRNTVCFSKGEKIINFTAVIIGGRQITVYRNHTKRELTLLSLFKNVDDDRVVIVIKTYTRKKYFTECGSPTKRHNLY